jgi:hypothetical protein
MILFWTIFKKRVFLLYMFVCIVGTILIASVFQWLVFVPGVDTGNQLFRNVSSLAGGHSSVILKEGNNVRIALDPAGKNIIATYTNDLANHGSIVFDAGAERFSAAAGGIENDRHYVANVATWLEQNSSSPSGKDILIYKISAVDDKGVARITEGVADVLRQATFSVTIADRTTTPQLNEKYITNFGQIWLFFPESGNKAMLTEDEVKLVAGFNERGNSMLISPVSGAENLQKDSSVNLLASRYGVQFAGSTDNTPRISVGISAQLFAAASEFLGKYLKIVHKA